MTPKPERFPWVSVAALCLTLIVIAALLPRPGYHPDISAEIEEDFRPFEQIQGTEYEDHAERFIGLRNSSQLRQMKAQIDREVSDCAILAGPDASWNDCNNRSRLARVLAALSLAGATVAALLHWRRETY